VCLTISQIFLFMKAVNPGLSYPRNPMLDMHQFMSLLSICTFYTENPGFIQDLEELGYLNKDFLPFFYQSKLGVAVCGRFLRPQNIQELLLTLSNTARLLEKLVTDPDPFNLLCYVDHFICDYCYCIVK
jgi:hypothetical protein